MSKYALLNAYMGGAAEYNDKIKSGRSLKFYRCFREGDKEVIEKNISLIPYVTKVIFGHTFVRVHVKNI